MAEERDNYTTVYSGSEVNVQHLQNLLNDANIHSFVKNNFESGLRSGFGGGLPGLVQLMVHESEFERAKKIAEETFPSDKTTEDE